MDIRANLTRFRRNENETSCADNSAQEKNFFWEFVGRFGFTIFQIVFLFLFLLQLLISVLVLSELKQISKDSNSFRQKALAPFTF